jgi:hypothetical protein
MGNENRERHRASSSRARSSTPQQPLERPARTRLRSSSRPFFDLPGVFAVDADDLVHVTDLGSSRADPDQLDTLLKTITRRPGRSTAAASVWLDRTKVPVVQARRST